MFPLDVSRCDALEQTMGKVSLVKAKGKIKQKLSESINLIGGPDIYVSQNATILLKSNLNGVEGIYEHKACGIIDRTTI